MLSRREKDECPCCGQRVLVRHGVKFPPKQADMLDMIERSGKAGITTEVLVAVFYPGKPKHAAGACVRVNVSHINEKLVETDIEVRASRYEPYRVRRRK